MIETRTPLTRLEAATLRMRAAHAEYTRHHAEHITAGEMTPCDKCRWLHALCEDTAHDFGMASS